MKETRREVIAVSIFQASKPLATIEKALQKITNFFNLFFAAVWSRRNFQRPQFIERINLRNIKFSKKNHIPYLILAVILIIVLIGGIALINQTAVFSSNNAGDSLKIAAPVSSKKLNREFKFSLKDDMGKEISKFSYVLESAELRKEILIKGQKATAVKGRIFLVLNLKFTNSLKQGINVNARDYVRLTVNNSNELLAPDIHNDPVEVQAISTKYTRVGFAINEEEKNITLQVGEIDGKKEEIKLSF